jgi:hypothetical protein
MTFAAIWSGGDPMDEGDQATLTDAEMQELQELVRSLVVGFVENQFKDMQVVPGDSGSGNTPGRRIPTR